MSKQLIQFAGVLFMLAAHLAVSAQENTTTLNNATMNNTTLLNNTTLNASVIEAPILPTETANDTASIETVSAGNESALAASEITPDQNEAVVVQNETVPVQNETIPTQIEVIAAQNETVPAQNVTMSENVTVAAEPVSTVSPKPAVSQPETIRIESPRRAAFAMGGENTPSLFQIGGKALPQEAYKVDLPAKTIMDMSSMPFFSNKI
jgi:hypothetical protein